MAAAAFDPDAALEQARALEATLRLTERTAVLDAIDAALATGDVGRAPAGREWALEVLAERAVDAARLNEIDTARERAEQVLAAAGAAPLAHARATEALGRALAWTGTAAASARAARVLGAAAEGYAALNRPDLQGFVVFWRANAVHLQLGRLAEAVDGMAAALDILPADSAHRANVLSFYGEALSALGQWQQADRVLAEGAELAEATDDGRARAYVAWAQAKLASYRGDAVTTERLLREIERDTGDWFEIHTGATFLSDAAEMLDRVGLHAEAADYLRRAVDRAPADEFVRQARATVLARCGDPLEALAALQELTRGLWLEKRSQWRHTLFAAWATFRAGREGSGALAARALEQAAELGGTQVATAAEPELVEALLPLAEAAGSAAARTLLAGERAVLVRVLGPTTVRAADGAELALPPGRPAELVRALAVAPGPVHVETVIEWFFPEVDVSAGRHRLRQVLARIRASAGPLVVREEDRLALAPAWVDARAFLDAANRVRAAGGARATQLAYYALARWGGVPLAADRYAPWAEGPRERLVVRYLDLLDLVAADAIARESHQEAITALGAALDIAPDDPERYDRLAAQLIAVGRTGLADHLARLGRRAEQRFGS